MENIFMINSTRATYIDKKSFSITLKKFVNNAKFKHQEIWCSFKKCLVTLDQNNVLFKGYFFYDFDLMTQYFIFKAVLADN